MLGVVGRGLGSVKSVLVVSRVLRTEPTSLALWSIGRALPDHKEVGLPVLDGENDSIVVGRPSALELSTLKTLWLEEGERLEGLNELEPVFGVAPGSVTPGSVIVLEGPAIPVALLLSVGMLGVVGKGSGSVESVLVG